MERECVFSRTLHPSKSSGNEKSQSPSLRFCQWTKIGQSTVSDGRAVGGGLDNGSITGRTRRYYDLVRSVPLDSDAADLIPAAMTPTLAGLFSFPLAAHFVGRDHQLLFRWPKRGAAIARM